MAALATGLSIWPGVHVGASSRGNPVHLVFQAVRCDSWSKVPANAPGVRIDDTGGHYVEWGPPLPAPVAAYSGGDLPPGCSLSDGVGVRLSGQVNGFALVSDSPSFQPVGQEDGFTTTYAGQTGASGPGRLDLNGTDLTPQQQGALFDLADGGGLWVSVVLPTLPGAFGNLRCHRDGYNADNREVIRPSPVDTTAVCVAYAVGVATQPAVVGPPPGGSAPPPPASSVIPPPGTPPPTSPPAPTESVGAPPPQAATSATPPAPAAATTSPAAPPSPPAPPPAATSQSGSPASGLSSPGPREAALGPTNVQSNGTVQPATPAVTAGPSVTAAPPIVPPLKIAPPTRMSVLVEVGGVTRGSTSSRPGAARSPWVRPVKVQLDCGEQLTSEVVVPVGQVPGFRLASDALVLPTADKPCLVRTEDAGVDLDSHRSDVVLKVDGSVLASGQWLRVAPNAGAEKQITVNVTFGVAKDQETVPATPAPTQPGGDQPLSLPLTLSLAAVFVVGLAGAVLRSRRPL